MTIYFLQPPKFEFYDPKTPFYTSPGFLPPTKIDKCRVCWCTLSSNLWIWWITFLLMFVGLIFQIVDAIISHGCFLRECTVQHSVVGERSRLDYGVELKVTRHLFFHSLHFLFPFWLLKWVITISLFSVSRIPWCLGQTTTKLKLKLPLFWQRVKSQLASEGTQKSGTGLNIGKQTENLNEIYGCLPPPTTSFFLLL